MIHVDLDLTRLTFSDTSHRYVEARAASLVSTYKIGRFVLSGALGDRLIRISSAANPDRNISGATYSGGVRYDATSWATFALSAGQDVLTSQSHGGPILTHYVRVDIDLRLI